MLGSLRKILLCRVFFCPAKEGYHRPFRESMHRLLVKDLGTQMDADDLIADLTSSQPGPVPYLFHPETMAVGPPAPCVFNEGLTPP